MPHPRGKRRLPEERPNSSGSRVYLHSQGAKMEGCCRYPHIYLVLYVDSPFSPRAAFETEIDKPRKIVPEASGNSGTVSVRGGGRGGISYARL